jgi:hypothetical protein
VRTLRRRPGPGPDRPRSGGTSVPEALSVIVAPVAMASMVLGREAKAVGDPEALVVVDESPEALVHCTALTPELLRTPDAFGDLAGRGRRPARSSSFALGTDRDGVDLPGGVAETLLTPEGAEAWRQRVQLRGEALGAGDVAAPADPSAPRTPPEPAAAVAEVVVALVAGGELWPHPQAMTVLRHRGRMPRPALEARWQMARALLALRRAIRPAGDTSPPPPDAVLAIDREGLVLRVTFRTLVGRALAAHAGPVVVLDGTGNAGRLGAELGATFREVAAVARERATVHRRVLAIPRATHTNWCPGGVPRWGDRQATLSGTPRALVERIRKDAPAGCAVALATFRPGALALAEAWKALLELPEGSAVLTEGPAALLAPLLGHVAELRLTHTGASDTRGRTRMQTARGRPRWGTGTRTSGTRATAAAVGTAEGARAGEHAEAALGQWHDRLRGCSARASCGATTRAPGGGHQRARPTPRVAPPILTRVRVKRAGTHRGSPVDDAVVLNVGADQELAGVEADDEDPEPGVRSGSSGTSSSPRCLPSSAYGPETSVDRSRRPSSGVGPRCGSHGRHRRGGPRVSFHPGVPLERPRGAASRVRQRGSARRREVLRRLRRLPGGPEQGRDARMGPPGAVGPPGSRP